MDRWFYTQAMNQLLDADGNRILIERGEGAFLYDHTGKSYIDFWNGFGAVTLGYGDEDLCAAVNALMSDGSYGVQLPSRHLGELGELLLGDFPGMDAAALFTGGTPALRAAAVMARRRTGKPLLLSAGYHGWDPMWGLAAEPFTPNQDQVIDFFFVLEELRTILSRCGTDIGALLLSPDRSYFSEAYYRELADLCAEHGLLVLIDDVKCGYRYRVGSSLPREVIAADAHIVSKGIANGARVAAMVGRQELMDEAADLCFTSFHDTHTAASAVATLTKLRRCEVPARIRVIGDRFIEGACERIQAAEVPMVITGNGNLFQFVCGDVEDAFYRLATQHGLALFPEDNQCPSFALTELICDDALNRFEHVVQDLARTVPASLGAEVPSRRVMEAAFNQCDGCLQDASLQDKRAFLADVFAQEHEHGE